jgi:hypothetical protein
MADTYTPKIGDILTGVDARGVRGPAPVIEPADGNGTFRVRFNFKHHAPFGALLPSGHAWYAKKSGAIPGYGLRVLFEPWQEPAEPAPKLTTIGKIARKGVKPGTVVAVHLVVTDWTNPVNTYRTLRLADAFDGVFWPHHDTPCTIISKPDPEPWKAGDEAVFMGERGPVVHVVGDEAWVRVGEMSVVVPLSNLERPQ